MLVSELRLHLGLEVSQVTGSGRVEPLDPIGRELRNGDGCQDPDDRHDDQQFDERKALPVSHFAQHSNSPFCGIGP